MQLNLITNCNLIDKMMAHCSALLCGIMFVVFFTFIEQVVQLQAHEMEMDEDDPDYYGNSYGTSPFGRLPGIDPDDAEYEREYDRDYPPAPDPPAALFFDDPDDDEPDAPDNDEENDNDDDADDDSTGDDSGNSRDPGGHPMFAGQQAGNIHPIAPKSDDLEYFDDQDDNDNDESRQVNQKIGMQSSPIPSPEPTQDTLVTLQEGNSKKGNFRWRIVASMNPNSTL